MIVRTASRWRCRFGGGGALRCVGRPAHRRHLDVMQHAVGEFVQPVGQLVERSVWLSSGSHPHLILVGRAGRGAGGQCGSNVWPTLAEQGDDQAGELLGSRSVGKVVAGRRG